MKRNMLCLLLAIAGVACAGQSKQRSDPTNPPIIDDPEVAPIGEPQAIRMTRPTTSDEAVALGGTQDPPQLIPRSSGSEEAAVAPANEGQKTNTGGSKRSSEAPELQPDVQR